MCVNTRLRFTLLQRYHRWYAVNSHPGLLSLIYDGQSRGSRWAPQHGARSGRGQRDILQQKPQMAATNRRGRQARAGVVLQENTMVLRDIVAKLQVTSFGMRTELLCFDSTVLICGSWHWCHTTHLVHLCSGGASCPRLVQISSWLHTAAFVHIFHGNILHGAILR